MSILAFALPDFTHYIQDFLAENVKDFARLETYECKMTIHVNGFCSLAERKKILESLHGCEAMSNFDSVEIRIMDTENRLDQGLQDSDTKRKKLEKKLKKEFLNSPVMRLGM